MAFATSNLLRDGNGSSALMRGSWTGTIGDASGTITGSGYCFDASFLTNSTSGPANPIRPVISNSSGTWTVTVPYSETITAGTFEIRFK